MVAKEKWRSGEEEKKWRKKGRGKKWTKWESGGQEVDCGPSGMHAALCGKV